MLGIAALSPTYGELGFVPYGIKFNVAVRFSNLLNKLFDVGSLNGILYSRIANKER